MDTRDVVVNMKQEGKLIVNRSRDELVREANGYRRTVLAFKLSRMGIILPTRAQMEKMPKDELVSMWIQKTMEPPCLHPGLGCAGSCRADIACND